LSLLLLRSLKNTLDFISLLTGCSANLALRSGVISR
jgi:hypothetical protein